MTLVSSLPLRRVLLAVAMAGPLALGACATADTPADSAARPAQSGVVRMRPDRSLEVTTLSSSSGGRANSVRIVPEEHRDYARILELTGPMKPGDQRPYTEPTDR